MRRHIKEASTRYPMGVVLSDTTEEGAVGIVSIPHWLFLGEFDFLYLITIVHTYRNCYIPQNWHMVTGRVKMSWSYLSLVYHILEMQHKLNSTNLKAH